MNPPPSVYIDTSVPSYLVAPRSRLRPIARRQLVSCLFWNAHRAHFSFFVSPDVLEEAGRGSKEEACKRVEVLASVTLVNAGGEADALARRIIRSTGLTGRAEDDAKHIAIAAKEGLDYLVTWNCKHLANPKIIPKVVRACKLAGFRAPQICTPEVIIRRVVYGQPIADS